MRGAASLTSAFVARWRARPSPPRGRVELGDFARRPPALEADRDSVYEALVRRYLHPRLAALGAPGTVIGIDAEPAWCDVLPDGSRAELVAATPDVHGTASNDWMVVDRWLQFLPEPAVGLGEIVRRLRPGGRLVTLFTGIARAEPNGRAPLWTVAPFAARRLHQEHADLEHVELEQLGNVTLALAWLYRLPAAELTERELAAVDPAYPLLVAVTASRRRS